MMARIARVEVGRLDYAAGRRVQVLQGRRASVGRRAPDRRRRRAGLGPVGAGRDLDLRDGRRPSRRRCGTISRRRCSAPIRPISPTCTLAWSAPSGRRSRSASRSARRRSTSPATTCGASRPDRSVSALLGEARATRDEAELDGQRHQPRPARGAARAGPRRGLRQLQRQARLRRRRRNTTASWCARCATFAPDGFHWADANTELRPGHRAARWRASSPTRASRRSSRRCRRTASATTRR